MKTWSVHVSERDNRFAMILDSEGDLIADYVPTFHAARIAAAGPVDESRWGGSLRPMPDPYRVKERRCVTIGHEHLRAMAEGTLHTDDEVHVGVCYCEACWVAIGNDCFTVTWRATYPVDLYPGCPCYACDYKTWDARPAGWTCLQRMNLCPTCGDKRCAGALDHRRHGTAGNSA